jgi:hypothetical protein
MARAASQEHGPPSRLCCWSPEQRRRLEKVALKFLGLLDFSGDNHRVILFAAISRGLLDALTLDEVVGV